MKSSKLSDAQKVFILNQGEVDAKDLKKCSRLLNQQSVPFADQGEWEVVSTLVGYVPGLCSLVE